MEAPSPSPAGGPGGTGGTRDNRGRNSSGTAGVVQIKNADGTLVMATSATASSATVTFSADPDRRQHDGGRRAQSPFRYDTVIPNNGDIWYDGTNLKVQLAA